MKFFNTSIFYIFFVMILSAKGFAAEAFPDTGDSETATQGALLSDQRVRGLAKKTDTLIVKLFLAVGVGDGDGDAKSAARFAENRERILYVRDDTDLQEKLRSLSDSCCATLLDLIQAVLTEIRELEAASGTDIEPCLKRLINFESFEDRQSDGELSSAGRDMMKNLRNKHFSCVRRTFIDELRAQIDVIRVTAILRENSFDEIARIRDRNPFLLLAKYEELFHNEFENYLLVLSNMLAGDTKTGLDCNPLLPETVVRYTTYDALASSVGQDVLDFHLMVMKLLMPCFNSAYLLELFRVERERLPHEKKKLLCRLQMYLLGYIPAPDLFCMSHVYQEMRLAKLTSKKHKSPTDVKRVQDIQASLSLDGPLQVYRRAQEEADAAFAAFSRGVTVEAWHASRLAEQRKRDKRKAQRARKKAAATIRISEPSAAADATIFPEDAMPPSLPTVVVAEGSGTASSPESLDLEAHQTVDAAVSEAGSAKPSFPLSLPEDDLFAACAAAAQENPDEDEAAAASVGLMSPVDLTPWTRYPSPKQKRRSPPQGAALPEQDPEAAAAAAPRHPAASSLVHAFRSIPRHQCSWTEFTRLMGGAGCAIQPVNGSIYKIGFPKSWGHPRTGAPHINVHKPHRYWDALGPNVLRYVIRSLQEKFPALTQ